MKYIFIPVSFTAFKKLVLKENYLFSYAGDLKQTVYSLDEVEICQSMDKFYKSGSKYLLLIFQV